MTHDSHDPAELEPRRREDLPEELPEGFWRVKDSIRALLEDDKVPKEVRDSLRGDYESLQAMLAKLEHGHIHVAAFGRVSVGKSSLLNALIGSPRFAVSALHGETKEASMQAWQESDDHGVYFMDTPGINEVDGDTREQLAIEVAGRCDLVIFVVDGDMTHSETQALDLLAAQNRPMLLVLNKADQYTQNELEQLLARLREHADSSVRAENVVTASASPRERIVLVQRSDGSELEERRQPEPDVKALRERLWHILEADGKTLAALNAGLFAGRLSDAVAQRITEVKREVASRLIRNYCVAKGLAVAINPVPVTDLAAAAALDITLVVHLSRVYGLPMTRMEAGRLLAEISAQLALLMGAVWGIHIISSALKTLSIGASVAFTAVAQGAAAYYATYVVGRCAERYFVAGKSWGKQGAKSAVKDILSGIDRASILQEAKSEIQARLRGNAEAHKPG